MTLRLILITLFGCMPACLSAQKKPYKSSGDYEGLVKKLYCNVEEPTKKKIKVRKIEFGESQKGKPLLAYVVDPAAGTKEERENIFIIGAQHGDERNTNRVLDFFVRELKETSEDFKNERRIIVVPLMNPDGYKRGRRLAEQDLDLNRDYPSKDGHKDAPRAQETEAFMALMKKYPPTVIYNFHQPFRVVLHYKGDEDLAEPFAQLADYPLGTGVGYPTPGSLGTWGQDNKVRVITVELARYMQKAHAPFIYEEVRLSLFNGAFGCIPKPMRKSRLEKYLAH